MDQGGSANNSSDFVSLPCARDRGEEWPLTSFYRFANYTSTHIITTTTNRSTVAYSNNDHRMLESPQDENVVRWGNEGDSFVVLEVRCAAISYEDTVLTTRAEREIHQAHPSEAFQA